MQRYVLNRILVGVLTLWAVSLLVFGLARVTGDPLEVYLPLEATEEDRARIAAEWGLDQPIYVQYVRYVWNILQGDFGGSWRWPGQKALNLALTRLGASLELAAVAVLFSVIVAIPIGVLAAVYKGSALDHAGKAIALLGQSIPHFWLGIMLMWIFGVRLGWLPTSGRGTIAHMIMPAVVIGWFSVAALMRLVRSSMLEVLDSEYIKLARIKGVPERAVIWKHAFRNATIPPLTYFGIMLGFIVVGSITTEVIFAWPGAGLLIIDAIRARDFQVVQAVALVFAVVFVIISLVVDILYAYLDPRIRYQ